MSRVLHAFHVNLVNFAVSRSFLSSSYGWQQKDGQRETDGRNAIRNESSCKQGSHDGRYQCAPDDVNTSKVTASMRFQRASASPRHRTRTKGSQSPVRGEPDN